MAGRFAGRADGNVPSGALRQSAGFHVRRGAAAGGGLLCRAGKSAAVRHAGNGQAAAGRDGRRGRFAGRADGNVPSGALRQSAGFHVRRGAAAGGGLLCRAGKSAAVRHAGNGQAAAGRDGRRGRFAGRADGNVPSGALRQSAGFHVRRAHRGRRRGAAAGGGLLCRAGKSAAVRHAGNGQAAAGRDGRRGPSADGALGLSAIHPLHHARVGRVASGAANPPTAICACICRLSRRWKT